MSERTDRVVSRIVRAFPAAWCGLVAANIVSIVLGWHGVTISAWQAYGYVLLYALVAGPSQTNMFARLIYVQMTSEAHADGAEFTGYTVRAVLLTIAWIVVLWIS